MANRTQIEQWVLNKIKTNKPLIAALMHLHGKGERTILKWIAENNPTLRTNDSIKVIAVYLRICPSAIIAEKEIDPDSLSDRLDNEIFHPHKEPQTH